MNASLPPAARVRSVCPYCGVGCGIVMEVRAGKVVKISGDRDHPTNAGRLCTKGTTAHQAIDAPGRLTQARLRDRATGESRPAPMTAAIAETAGRLRGILDAHGPDAIALYVSGQMSIEAQYLANKLAKGFLRTRHIESNSRLCMASAGSGYKLSLGADAPPGSYDDFEKADLFLVIGANMADCHPILFLRMMDRVKAGARLIVVDPRRTATAEKADLFLQLRPGSDLALLNGLLHILLRDGRIDRDFIARHTDGWEEMPAFLAPYTPEAVARTTGLPMEAIETAAHMIGETGEWMSLWTMGLNQSTHGTWNTNAVCNLHLATGAICRPGSGPFSLTGQPNAMGGREMGYMGPGLPGQRSALSEADRAFAEAVWRLPPGTIRAEAGDGTVAMWEEMAEGRVKACWIICTNPVASMANRAKVVEALGTAELVILQDVFEGTETSAHADILLPAALWAEAVGVMVNSERNLTLAPRAVDPPGEAMADWEIIARVAQAMGFGEGFAHASAAEVFEEIAAFANPATGYDISGTSHMRLAEGPVQWPAAPGGAARNPIRYLAPDGPRFPTPSGRAMFWPRPHLDPAEMPDDAHPFVLTTGRVQHQWHTLTKTGRIPTLNRLNPAPFVEINPADAANLGVTAGDTVILRSRRGEARLPALLNDRMRPGTCFAPFHWADAFGEGIAVNAVTSDAVDPISLQPELKHCAVSLIPAPKSPRPGIERKEAPQMSRIDMLAELLGLDPVAPIALEAEERSYMQGFLGALRADGGLDAGGCGVPVLPPSAPLSPARRLLLDGMLAGVFSRSHAPSGVIVQAAEEEVLILWASQTGNAEAIAGGCATRLAAPGRRIRTLGMDAITPGTLAEVRTVLFIASTFGDGDAPDNAAAFWRMLNEAAMPRLEGLRYALLALGDPSYAQFCGFGRRLDARLAALGAAPFLPRRECEPDYHAAVEDWLAGVSSALHSTAKPDSPRHGRDNPLPARLKANRLLSGPGSAKEVRQIIFDIKGTALSYEAGDALGVWPVNAPAEVERFIASLSLDPGERVEVKGKGEMALSEALARHYDLTRLSPELSALMEEAAQAGTETGGALLARPAGEILASLRRLQPRLYSISSSPALHPAEVHLTMSTVRFGNGRGGVCSSFLADRAEAGPVEIFVQKSAHFRLPADPARDAVMIGPGTGIAPFRAFLQQRAATGASGRNWLFFGEQRSDCDFYYREELDVLMAQGVLTRLDTAFSRDQGEKIYVQDRMRAAGADLWRWIEGGAHVYVCGDAARMARDVDQALAALIAGHGGLTAADARARLEEMARTRTYVRDVY